MLIVKTSKENNGQFVKIVKIFLFEIRLCFTIQKLVSVQGKLPLIYCYSIYCNDVMCKSREQRLITKEHKAMHTNMLYTPVL